MTMMTMMTMFLWVNILALKSNIWISQIEEAIRELDEKKNEALKKAYEQVR